MTDHSGRGGGSSRSRPPVKTTASPPDAPPAGWRLTLPAQATSLRLLRRSLTDWLRQLGWPADEQDDLLLAVNEAVSNSVEHAYVGSKTPGSVRLDGVVELVARGLRRLRIVVEDDGRWRSDTHDHRQTGRPRGRGLSLMRGLMASVSVAAGPVIGTRVILLSPAVPAAAAAPR